MFGPKALRIGLALVACAAAIVALGGCSKDRRPTVVSTDPADGATGVPLGAVIIANFSRGMDPATITAETFTLTRGTTPVAGTVTCNGVTATFNPGDDLAPNTLYTAKIRTGAEALGEKGMAQAGKCEVCPGTVLGITALAAGGIVVASVLGCNPESVNVLEEDYVWTFTTGPIAQTLGTTSIFEGNVLARESVTPATGATLEGRALTQTVAVTLDAAVIAVPALYSRTPSV